MKKYYLLTLLTVLLSTSLDAHSATGSFSVTATAVASYDVTTNFDFSSVPFTKNNQIKTYNLDDFIVNKKEPKSNLEGMGLIVAIDKYKEGDRVIVNVIHQ